MQVSNIAQIIELKDVPSGIVIKHTVNNLSRHTIQLFKRQTDRVKGIVDNKTYKNHFLESKHRCDWLYQVCYKKEMPI